MTEVEASPCIGCGSTITKHLLTKPQPGGDVILNRCNSCGLTFNARWPQLSKAEDYEYYADRVEWPEHRLHDPLNTTRYHELLERLEASIAGRSLLDVGCGAGHLVRVAVDRGWDATGIELSPAAVKICERFSLPCQVEDFFSSTLDGEAFDLITMIEVIEHVPQPGAFLRRAAELLAPSGMLYLTTPNFNALTRRLARRNWGPISDEHLTYFTPKTLRQLLCTTTALGPMKIETRNVSLTELRRLLRRSEAPAATSFQGSPSASADYATRIKIEKFRTLKIAKQLADRILTVGGAGETIAVSAAHTQ